EGSFMEYATSTEPVADALAGARRVGKFLGIVRWEGFFREAAGAGWVLVGDAGYFKDPTPGQGIGDAFGQVDRLAPVIASGLRGSDRRALLRDVGMLVAEGARHDRLTRKPQYVEVGAAADAGETEVD